MSKIFPIIDHLYIFQIFEYHSLSFLRWFLKNPFKRDLQKKHKLAFSKKALGILVLANLLMLLHSIYSAYALGSIWWVPVVFVMYQVLSPLYLIVANFLFRPVDFYLKRKILKACERKLKRLPDLKVVGITGSFGKTSTKDILYVLLNKKFRVVKTPKSFNTPLGVAGTVVELVKENTEVLIAEIGAYKKGEIRNIARLTKPEIGIITAVAPQHLERFGSIENIAHAKFELVEGVSRDGVGILSGKSEWLQKLGGDFKGCRVIYYGRDEDKFRVSGVEIDEKGTSFKLHTSKGSVEIKIPLIGEHHAQNFLAAAVAALELGMSLEEIKKRALWLLPTPHRLEVKKMGEMTLIDNSFNTNAETAKSSLELLRKIKGTKKIVMTPGLVELGEKAFEENKKFASEIAKVADEVILIGEENKEALKVGFGKFADKRIHLVESTRGAFVKLSEIGQSGAVVLLENDLPDQYS